MTKYAKTIRLTQEQLDAQREAARRRQAEFLARKRADGLTKISFFLDQDNAERVRAYVARITKAAERKKPCK